MRIWIGGGGTGGHVYPGLAVAAALSAEAEARAEPAPSVMYVGGEGEVERDLSMRAGLPFIAVPAGGLHGVGVRAGLRNAVRLLRGWLAAYRLGQRERPDAVFVTGGYASVPVALAAYTLRIPVLVYLPDIEPGLAVRFIGRLARQVAVTVRDSASYFEGRDVVVAGYPLRPEFGDLTRTAGRDALGLHRSDPAVVLFGGSRGSQSINSAVERTLDGLLSLAQVVHVTGAEDWSRVASQLGGLDARAAGRYRVFPYLHDEMAAALVAADLVVCRAGASVLGELPACGVPAILVPYPHAWRYQRVNAEWLVSRGAAMLIEDDRLDEDLGPAIRELLQDRPRLAEMAQRMSALARPGASRRLAECLFAMAG